jgi:hypothetical protein
MEIAEKQIDTPTLAMLKRKVTELGKHPYAFVLTDRDLTALRLAGMSLSAIAAYACIRGAVRAGWRHEWVTLPPRTIAAVGRDRRWWYEQTQRLERAGFIACERQPGRLPRYRLRQARAA